MPGGVGWTLLIALTPASQDLVDAVQEIDVDTSTEMAGAFRIRFGLRQTEVGDWSILQVDPFRPLVPISVRVTVDGPVPVALINGYVTHHQVLYADEPGRSVLEVTGMDATILMNLQERVMPWPSMPDSAIAAAIFGQYGVVPQVQPTSPVLTEPEGTTTQRSSDIQFLRRLAARNGFECFVLPEPVSGIDTGYFRPPSLVGVPEAVLSVSFGDLTNVTNFSISYDMVQPTGALTASLDVATKAPQIGVAPVSTATPLGLEPALLRVLPPPMMRSSRTGVVRTGDLQGVAQAIVDRSSFAVVASGDVAPDSKPLRPGALVNLRGAGREYNGTYYVTRVHHHISQEGYLQSFEARRNAVSMTGTEVYALP